MKNQLKSQLFYLFITVKISITCNYECFRAVDSQEEIKLYIINDGSIDERCDYQEVLSIVSQADNLCFARKSRCAFSRNLGLQTVKLSG